MARLDASRAPLFAFLAVLAAVGYEAAKMVAPFVLPIVLGATLSALSRPAYRRVRRWGLGPRSSALAITAGVFVLIVVPMSLVVVRAVSQATRVFTDLRESGQLTPEGLAARLERVPVARRLAKDPVALRRNAIELGRRSSGAAGLVLGKVAKGVPRFLVELALAVVALYFFLVDGPRFVEWLLSRSTLDPIVRESALAALHGTAIATVWASLATTAVQALVVLVGFLATGVPAPFLAGCAAFLLAWVPLVHTLPVLAAGAAYLYVQGHTARLVGLVVAAVVAAVVDNFLRPLILRRGHDMHPFVGLLAVLGGIHLFGIVGVFLGPILAALLVSLLDLWPTLAERSGVGPTAPGPMDPGPGA